MKIVFVGPTLPDAETLAAPDIFVRGPAVQGDIFAAVEGGAAVVGLIDGNFEFVAPVWHKEILYALSQGVTVLGGASMGALRAAECAAFGMIGIGEVYRRFADGRSDDDADVALLHGPAELGFMPLTLPLVNVVATLTDLADRSQITAADCVALQTAAAAIFYKHRTWPEILRQAALPGTPDRPDLLTILRAGAVNQKRADALELLACMRMLPDTRAATGPAWQFQATSMWKTAFGARVNVVEKTEIPRERRVTPKSRAIRID